MKLKSSVSRGLLKACTSVEAVFESDYCHIGMTAVVMGDVNAAYTLECAHRRQVLAARAVHERSLLISGLPFPRTKTIGDVFFDDLVILSVLHFSDVHLASEPKLCVTSSRCSQMLASQAVRSRESFGEEAWTEGRRSPSLFDEKYSPASVCPTLLPPRCCHLIRCRLNGALLCQRACT